MKKLKRLNIAFLIVLFAVLSCKKGSNPITDNNKEKDSPSQKVQWTDFMNNNFDTGWGTEVEAGQWWWQSSAGINWAIVEATNSSQKGRVEVSRDIFNFTGDRTVTIKGKFKMETTADGGFPNQGGWVMQTMAWHFTDPSGTVQYKPMVVLQMLPSGLYYLVYDYYFDSSGNPQVKSGYPIQKTILSSTMAGQTEEVALKIKFSKTSAGSVEPWLNGSWVTAANYSGVTYPPAFPNSRVKWKGGCYASHYGSHHAKIGLYYLYTDAL